MRVSATLLVVCLVVLAGCTGGIGLGQEPGNGGEHRTTKVEETVSAAFVTGENRTAVTLEVANSPSEREHGLMYRKSLPKNHGMVFVFGNPQVQSFWMKNTLIPLDIIFVGPDGTVLNVAHADTQPNASDWQLREYRSDGNAKYVVEMRQGFAKRAGIESGTKLVFEDGTPTTEQS
ncbi:DUF192 domain-containing protein [Haladaptatus sp.]|uniref:DUF192 domain-containing protein n=1 Tax=Haladaptatus sp. TaxID=1973141 RepID=UPI003C59CA1C